MVDGRNRRVHQRALGPFDAARIGPIDLPIRLYDLSLGGCFVNDVHDPPPRGRKFRLRIELPEDAITVRAEAVYGRSGFGYAVRFVEFAEDGEERLERALDRLAVPA